MNHQALLDHALGLLDDDDPARREIAEALAADPDLAVAFGNLDRNLRFMLDDGPPPEPRNNLAERTIAMVAAEIEMTRTKPRSKLLPMAPTAVPFRRADLAVAAGIFVASLLTLMPGMHRSWRNQSQIACLSNLQQLGTALNRYAQKYESYPYPDPTSENSLCGCFAAILNDEGLLHSADLLHCPSSANHGTPHPETPPTMKPLKSQSIPNPANFQADYAYHRGVQPAGELPRSAIPAQLVQAVFPLLADEPPHRPNGTVLRGNSRNHGGGGQNVLFADGHAAWRRSRWISRDDKDLFLNEDLLPAPGVHSQDSSLGVSIVPVLSGHGH